MSQPDFEAAKQYALHRLEKELAPDLFYHNLTHTRDKVLPGVIRLAMMSGISLEETKLLEVAASYHDIGFLIQSEEHERIGAEIAAQVLPRFAFSAAQISTIVGLIMATRVPQSPQTVLEEIMADADLDVLGREDDFWPRNEQLRSELAAYGHPTTDDEWNRGQLNFVENHTYFTEAARSLRKEGKRKHIAELKKRLKTGS